MKHIFLLYLIFISFLSQAQNKWAFGITGALNSGGLPSWHIEEEPGNNPIEVTRFLPLLSPSAGLTMEFKVCPNFSILSDLNYHIVGGKAYYSRETTQYNLFKSQTWTKSLFQNLELPVYFASAFHIKNTNWQFQYGYILSYAISGSFTQTFIYTDYADSFGEESIETSEVKTNPFVSEDSYDEIPNRINHQLMLGLSTVLGENFKLNFRMSTGNYYTYANCFGSENSFCVLCDGISYRKFNYTAGLSYYFSK